MIDVANSFDDQHFLRLSWLDDLELMVNLSHHIYEARNKGSKAGETLVCLW